MSSRRNEMRNYKTNLRERRRRHNYNHDYSQQYLEAYMRKVHDYLDAKEAAINEECETCPKFATCAINFSIMF